MAEGKIPEDQNNFNESNPRKESSTEFDRLKLENIHFRILGDLLCKDIHSFQEALFKEDAEIAHHVYKMRSYQDLISCRDRFEEVALLGKSR